MLDRLSSYFLIVAASIFAAVQGFAIVKHVRLHGGLTTPDYLGGINIVVALVAIAIAIRLLARDRSLPNVEQARSRLDAPGSFQDLLQQFTTFSVRRPVLMPLVILSFLVIPLALRAFGKLHGWNDFDFRDWILIGIAETPIAILAIVSVIVSRKSIVERRVGPAKPKRTAE
jgi:hypothetical protein